MGNLKREWRLGDSLSRYDDDSDSDVIVNHYDTESEPEEQSKSILINPLENTPLPKNRSTEEDDQKPEGPEASETINHATRSSSVTSPVNDGLAKHTGSSTHKPANIAAGQDPYNVGINATYFQSWMTALQLDDIELVGRLIAEGLNIQIPIYEDLLPLCLAARRSVKITRYLLEIGADVDGQAGSSGTPLQNAVKYNALAEEVTELLLEYGADVNAPAGKCGTALTAAAQIDTVTLASILLNHGAKMTLENGEPDPGVLHAVSAGFVDMVLLFLEYGADPVTVIEDWETKHKDMPCTLQQWEDVALRYSYDNLEHVAWTWYVSPTPHDCLKMRWEWEVPAMIQMARSLGVAAPYIGNWLLKDNVVLVAQTASAPVTATSCCDLLLPHSRGEIFDILVEFLNAVAARDLAGDDGEFVVSSDSLYPDDLTIFRSNLVDFDFWELRISSKTLTLRGQFIISFRQAKTVDALDWLCRTIHKPQPEGSMIVSEAVYTLEQCEVSRGLSDRAFQAKGHIPRYEVLPFMRLTSSELPAHEHDCWRPLLNSCVVSVLKNFPFSRVDELDQGKGLKMSFELMVSLAAVEYELIINGGVVFVGYQTVLFPTAISRKYAQFHVVVSNGGQINPYTLDLPQRLLTDDSSQFKNMQCFLGWCEAAQINLGTKNLSANGVRYSGGRDQERKLVLEGQSTQLQIGVQSPVSLLAGLQTNFTFVSCRRQFTPADSYAKLLQDTAEELAIVYDAGQRRCWLLPKLSLLLHMSHAYAQRRALPGDRVPHVDPHADSRNIIEFLKDYGEIPILEDQTHPFLFRQLLQGLNLNLLATVSAVQQCSGKKLYGFEFLDVVTSPGRGSCMKKLELESAGKAWLDIVNVVDAVVVCSDLGEAITAVEDSGRRSPCCNAMPKNQDYLAATLPCLNRLIERKGGRLTPRDGFQGVKISEDSYWHLCGNPFEACQHGTSGDSSCWKRLDIIQRLEPAKTFKLMRVISRLPSSPPVSNIPFSGAVVFGRQVV